MKNQNEKQKERRKQLGLILFIVLAFMSGLMGYNKGMLTADVEYQGITISAEIDIMKTFQKVLDQNRTLKTTVKILNGIIKEQGITIENLEELLNAPSISAPSHNWDTYINDPYYEDSEGDKGPENSQEEPADQEDPGEIDDDDDNGHGNDDDGHDEDNTGNSHHDDDDDSDDNRHHDNE